jgi:hypothetical protein
MRNRLAIHPHGSIVLSVSTTHTESTGVIMRNVTFTLTSAQRDQACGWANVLQCAQDNGERVAFLYTPREGGEATTREGEVIGFAGTPGTSTHAVKVLTDKGPRTFNLYLIG